MPHISFSELKNWHKCAHYHKLVHVDKLKGFEGNAHTAFGSAIHDVCEHMILKGADEGCAEMFELKFLEQLKSLKPELREKLDRSLVMGMRTQGKEILPLVLDAVKDYFGSYEVVSTEEKLMIPIFDYILK